MNCVLLQGASDTSADVMCSNNLGKVCYFFKTFFCRMQNNMVAVQKKLYTFWFDCHD